jgi:hypothetical protein
MLEWSGRIPEYAIAVEAKGTSSLIVQLNNNAHCVRMDLRSVLRSKSRLLIKGDYSHVAVINAAIGSGL